MLHDEIARLSERYRVVIVLCDLEGLTEGQAAVRLGLPVGTVRSRLRRGRERLAWPSPQSRRNALHAGGRFNLRVRWRSRCRLNCVGLFGNSSGVVLRGWRDADIRGGPDNDFDPDGNGAEARWSSQN